MLITRVYINRMITDVTSKAKSGPIPALVSRFSEKFSVGDDALKTRIVSVDDVIEVILVNPEMEEFFTQL